MSGIIGAGSRSGVINETELDYEEGTWTPTMQDGGSSFGYNLGDWGTFGYYTKIGNVVYIKGRLVLTSGSMTTGTVTISLPITPSGWGTGDVSQICCMLNASTSVDSAYTGTIGSVNTNTNGLSIRQELDTGSQTALYGTQFGANGNLSFAGHYFVSP